jgi:hypothetical protein
LSGTTSIPVQCAGRQIQTKTQEPSKKRKLDYEQPPPCPELKAASTNQIKRLIAQLITNKTHLFQG